MKRIPQIQQNRIAKSHTVFVVMSLYPTKVLLQSLLHPRTLSNSKASCLGLPIDYY